MAACSMVDSVKVNNSDYLFVYLAVDAELKSSNFFLLNPEKDISPWVFRSVQYSPSKLLGGRPFIDKIIAP